MYGQALDSAVISNIFGFRCVFIMVFTPYPGGQNKITVRQGLVHLEYIFYK